MFFFIIAVSVGAVVRGNHRGKIKAVGIVFHLGNGFKHPRLKPGAQFVTFGGNARLCHIHFNLIDPLLQHRFKRPALRPQFGGNTGHEFPVGFKPRAP